MKKLLGAIGGLVVAVLAVVMLTAVCSVPPLRWIACFGMPAPPPWEVLAMLAMGVYVGVTAVE